MIGRRRREDTLVVQTAYLGNVGREVIPCDKRGVDRDWAGLTRLAAPRRKRGYARAFLADGSSRERVARPLHGHGTAKLAALAGVARGEQLPVTNTSAALHLATAVGTPVVALLGPTTPTFGFGPLGAGGVVLGLTELLCRPCMQPGPAACPLEHHRCMVELGAAAVLDALSSVLRDQETRRAVRARH